MDRACLLQAGLRHLSFQTGTSEFFKYLLQRIKIQIQVFNRLKIAEVRRNRGRYFFQKLYSNNLL
jgi:hypothetical protein